MTKPRPGGDESETAVSLKAHTHTRASICCMVHITAVTAVEPDPLRPDQASELDVERATPSSSTGLFIPEALSECYWCSGTSYSNPPNGKHEGPT